MESRFDLSLTPFPLVLSRLYEGGATGALLLNSGSHVKRVFLQAGAVIFAASNDRNDRLGEMLLRRGVLRLDDYLAASAGVVPGKRFGTILVEKGILTPGQLVWAVKEQVKEIAFSLFSLPSGTCQLVPEAEAGGEVITLTINTPELLRQGIARMDTITWPLDTFKDGEARLKLEKPLSEITAMFALSDGEAEMVAALERGSTVAGLCRESQLSHFVMLKLLWALAILNLVRIVPHEGSAKAGDAEEPIDFGVTGSDLTDLA